MNLPKGKEDALQVSCVAWFGLQYPHLKYLLHHSPNGGHRNAIEAAKFKRMGVRPGFPDLILCVASGGFHGLFMELKSDTGKQSLYQKEFQIRLTDQGYRYEIIRSVDQFIETVKDYLRNGDTADHIKSSGG